MRYLFQVKALLLLALFAFGSFQVTAQKERKGYKKVREQIDRRGLEKLQRRLSKDWQRDSVLIEAYKKKHGEDAVYRVEEDGTVIRLVGFEEDGTPIFYETHNAGAAVTSNTHEVKPGGSSPYNLTGKGVIIGIWDGGDVRATHQEFGNRVTVYDSVGSSSHATHVAGTIGASGVNPDAEGMSSEADLWSWSFGGNESAQMTGFASQGNILSNHSYGTIAGWRYNSGSEVWRWYGDTTISGTEDYDYGRYSSKAELWDTMIYANPYYVVAKSAGNNRNSTGPGSGDPYHEIRDPNSNNWIPSTTPRPADCPNGYKCITTYSNAKNIITVGAVEEVQNYTGPASINMSSFSSWGPTDDGRLKPEITAKGVSLFSSDNDNDSDYGSKSGTSMSTPTVTGNIGLIQQLSDSLNSYFLKASTIKALLAETAIEAGNGPEPDYAYGFGLMDTKAACDVVARKTATDTIIENSLTQGDTFTMTVTVDGSHPLSATLAWTDPPGDANWPVVLNDTTPALVNDLDIVLIDSSGNKFRPYVMDPANPSAPASTGKNRRDNIEKVLLTNPDSGTYTVRITHKSTLEHGFQDFSLVTSQSNLIGCYAPHEVADVYIGTDEAVITWSSLSNAGQHEYVITPAGAGISAGTPVVVNTDTVLITGLSPSTEYDFYVRDICSPGDTSALGPDYKFRTNCSVTSLPFHENFDGPQWTSGSGAANNNDAVDSCWFREPDTSGVFFWGTRSGETASNNTGPDGDNTTGTGNYIYTEGSDGSSNDPARMTGPLVDLTGSVNPILRYAYHMHGSNIETLYTKINNGNGWVTLDSITGEQQTDKDDPWLWDTLDISAYTGDTVQIRFYTERGSSWRNDVAIDDVSMINRYDDDLSVSRIMPLANVCAQENNQIAVEVKNYGFNDQSGFDVELHLAGTPALTETITYTGTLKGGATDTLVFDSLPLHSGGTWDLTSFAVFSLDQNPNNDTAYVTDYKLTQKPQKPVFPSDSITVCRSGDTLISTSSASDELITWYDQNGQELATGDSFLIEPAVLTDTVFADRKIQVTGSAGAENNNIGAGGTYSSFASQHMNFEVHETTIIDSVTVYPGSSGTVGFRIRNNFGTILFATTENVNSASAGDAVTIPVGAVLEPGTNYRADAGGSTVNNLFRNTSGAAYPYEATNSSLTITGNSFSSNYYYFFYDWEIRSYTCPSEQTALYIDTYGPDVNLGSDTGYCENESIAFTVNAGHPGAIHQWNTGAITPVINIDTAGNYRVTVTDSSGCSVEDNIMVTEHSLPSVSVQNIHLCGGDTGIMNVPGSFDSISWSTGEDTNTIEVTQGGFYSVTVVDDNGCENSDSGEAVLTNPPNVDLGSDKYVKPNETVTLDAGLPGMEYEWSTGDSTQTIEAGIGTYSVTVTDLFGCEGSDSIEVKLGTGIGTLKSGSVVVYPNPVNNTLRIELDAKISQEVAIELYDAAGKQLIHRRETTGGNTRYTLDMSSLSSGLYILKIRAEKNDAPQTFKINKR